MNALQFYEYEQTGIINPLLMSIDNPVCGVDCALCDELSDGLGLTCPKGRYDSQGIFGEINLKGKYGFYMPDTLSEFLKDCPLPSGK